MLRQDRVAERVAMQKLREQEEEEDAAKAEAAATAVKTFKPTAGDGASGQMVFGGGPKNWAGYEENGVTFELGDDSSSEDDDDDKDDDGDSTAIGSSVTGLTGAGGGDAAARREHKRLKHWGKKNRKLR